jgi:hypothetical protein
VGEHVSKKLDRDAGAELGVRRLIHLAHATRSQVAGNLIMCDFGSGHDRSPDRILTEFISDKCFVKALSQLAKVLDEGEISVRRFG